MISKTYISGNNWGSCWGSGKMLRGCFASIHNENISITNFWGCFSHVRRTLTDYHNWDIDIMIWKLNVKVVLLQFHFCWWRSPSNFMNKKVGRQPYKFFCEKCLILGNIFRKSFHFTVLRMQPRFLGYVLNILNFG